MNGEIGFSGTLEGFVNAGGGGGEVPTIYADATVDDNTGTPAVTVRKTVSPSGDINTFTFEFQNLKGEPGQQGQQGIPGIQGERGLTGERGPRGFQGETGSPGSPGSDGYSPTVNITTLTDPDGHRVTITDLTHPLGQSFDVMDGERGPQGEQGVPGQNGSDGVGVPAGGTTSQVLAKIGPGDYLTEWVDPTPDAFPLISDEYDDHTAYAVGDYCIYENTLYKCNTAISPYEVWDSTHWDACNVGEEIAAANSEISTINQSLTQKQDTITLTTLSNGNYGSFENGGYFTIGNLVIFDVTFTTSGATTGQNLISGFPSISQNDKPFFCMMMGNVNNDLKAVRIYQNGLYPNSNLGAGRYHAYGMYIKS